MELVTGSGLHVEVSGAGDPVLLLHSSGLSGRQWRRLCSELVERGMRAVVPDLSGHGASDAWPEPISFSFRTDVDRVVAVLQAEEPAHVIGHSYGGLVALHAALAAPRSIRSLSLVDPVAFGALEAAADTDARAALDEIDLSWGTTAAERERWLQTFVDYWGGPGAWAALREPARAEFRRVAWVVREGVRSLMEDTTPVRAYGAFRFPVQLVTGEKSPLTARRVTQRLREAIRDARLATVPDAGHLAPVTHPELVNPILLDAVERAQSITSSQASDQG
jgi:pimeloyl-ACP methyl ester carboxylesterase